MTTRTRRGGRQWTDRASAQDVAALAGVSPQTVSRVVNGSPSVRPETKDRVLAAMTQLGYTPNAAARTLRRGHSKMIGVVVHHLGRTGEANIVAAVANTARSHGYDVFLIDAPSETSTDISHAITRSGQAIDGLVVLGLETVDMERVQFPSRLPIVVADSRMLPHPTVGVDQRGGAHQAVTHLLSLGHKTVHLLAGPQESLQAQQRESAWQETLLAAGREVPPPWRGDWSPASGYHQGKLIASDPDVTAVFAANDEMAAGLLRALHEAGRKIPHEVSVVGFDDILAEYLWPPLTSVSQQFDQLGEQIVQLLISQINNDDTAFVTTLVPAVLHIRDSSGVAPRFDGEILF